MITRIAKIKGFNNVLSGRDLAGIFKDGHVYQVTEIMGEIILKDLGEHAIFKSSYPFGNHKLTTIIMDGTYCLTKAEYASQLKEEQDDEDF